MRGENKNLCISVFIFHLSFLISFWLKNFVNISERVEKCGITAEIIFCRFFVEKPHAFAAQIMQGFVNRSNFKNKDRTRNIAVIFNRYVLFTFKRNKFATFVREFQMIFIL